MPAAETARLIASLELKDKLSPGVTSATRSLGKLDTSLGRIGTSAKRGAGIAAKAIAGIGVAAGIGIFAGVKTGLDNLTELESAVTATDGAIAQMGLTGKVTGKQIADWAAVIEDSTGAAFDEKPITLATGTLIRYGKVATSNLQPAMAVMVDLAAKTGDVDSAATLLAKALADPEKAAGKLARQGVVLTKVQQDQIKAFMKAGDMASAQKVILDSLAVTTKGAALASQGPYAQAQAKLADATEHATMALAEGFLPILTRVADTLGKKLADPKVMADIRSFGQSLAGGFDKALSFAEKINWDSVRSAASAIGSGAKMLLDAFLGMPAWVQTAVVGGWGLNKLTGGALGDIVGELGKGLVRGVLGINAGVVNVSGKVVSGGGGAVGAGGAGGKVGSVLGAVGKVFIVGAAVGVAAELWGVRQEQSTANVAQGKALGAQASGYATFATAPELQASLNGIESYQAQLLNSLTPEAIAYQMNLDGVRTKLDEVKSTLSNQLTALYDTRSEGAATRRGIEGMKGAEQASLTAFRAGERASASGLAGVRTAALSSAAAIRAKKWNVDVTVPVRLVTNVSVRDVTKQTITFGRYNGKTVPV